MACAGEVPGMGGIGNGQGFSGNVEALAAYRLKMSTVHGVKEPNLKTKILGIELALPVIAAPIGGIAFNMNEVSSYTSVLSALTFERFSDKLTTSLNMTRENVVQNKSPIEKVISM
jgi:isopentenyl diphosphate isomerase/L-lactate dehydrogenase-like FMN-dependent dehydrogenase